MAKKAVKAVNNETDFTFENPNRATIRFNRANILEVSNNGEALTVTCKLINEITKKTYIGVANLSEVE